MKKKIAVFIVFSAAAILIACVIHHCAQEPYHYEGIIKSIDIDENGNAFLETESVHGEALIKIVIYCNQKIPYWDGSYLQPAELQIGFVIDADFAKQKEGDYYTLKRMVVFPSVLSIESSHLSENVFSIAEIFTINKDINKITILKFE